VSRGTMALTARQALGYLLGLVALFFAVGVVLYFGAIITGAFPVSFHLLVNLAITFVIGYAAILLGGHFLRRIATRVAGTRRASLAFSAYRLVAYTLLVVVLLLVAGINSVALLAGGTFAGLVIGLAGQAVLSNVIAGVMLIAVRPMEPGERVTLTTWQYGLLAPTYPPRYYSNEFLVPGYTGTVSELGLVYSRIHLDDGPWMRIPNSILIQAAVLSHNVSERWVRVKLEVAREIDPQRLLARLLEVLSQNNWVLRPELLRAIVTEVTATGYVVAVDAVCRGAAEEPPRSALLIQMMALVREMGPPPPARSRAGREPRERSPA
jgi:small conductance mechanosensitive channel